MISLSTLDSLQLTQEHFYRESRFAEVFVSLKRAPQSLEQRIREIPGVQQVETRIVATVTLDINDFPDPVTGLLVSIPDDGIALLNRLHLRQGRLIAPDRNDEVVISETFAKAHALLPGDMLRATINGRRKTLNIVGIALSPEYIYSIQPGELFPDFKRYGILWMGRTPLSTAYDRKDAFNDIVLALTVQASLQDVLDRLDKLLEPYGGLGAYAREDQLSHHYLPFLNYRLEPGVIVAAGLISCAAAVLGTLHAVRRAALLPPVQAMRPEPPATYRETWIERLGLKNLLSQPARMILRNLERQPIKALLSITGIAFACAIMMVGSFQDVVSL